MVGGAPDERLRETLFRSMAAGVPDKEIGNSPKIEHIPRLSNTRIPGILVH